MEKSWKAVSPQHPQFAIKQLVEAIGVERENIITLGAASGDLAWLASELMRPSDVSDGWQQALAGRGGRIKRALENVALVEARDKNDEASIIALMMRQALEKPTGDMALVTADRDLARRVKANLSRWSIGVDDFAGERFSRFGAASLLVLLMDAAEENFWPPPCKACSAIRLRRLVLNGNISVPRHESVEVALFRSSANGSRPERLAALARTGFPAKSKTESHLHPLVAHLTESDWHGMHAFLARVVEMLAPALAMLYRRIQGASRRPDLRGGRNFRRRILGWRGRGGT